MMKRFLTTLLLVLTCGTSFAATPVLKDIGGATSSDFRTLKPIVDANHPTFANLSACLQKVSASGGGTVRVSTPMAINDKTRPTNVEIEIVKRGSINPNSGKAFNWNGGVPVGDPLYQIHGGLGTVVGLAKAAPDWWTTNAEPGVTDMTAAIVAAQNAAIAQDGRVYFPSRSYLHDSVSIANKIQWHGNGAVNTELKLKANATGHQIVFPAGVSNAQLHGFYINGNKANQTVAYDCVHFDDAGSGTYFNGVFDCIISTPKGRGAYVGTNRQAGTLERVRVESADSDGVYLGSADNRIKNSEIKNSGGNGVVIAESANVIDNCDIHNNTLNGVHFTGVGNYSHIVGRTSIDRNVQRGVYIEGSGNTIGNSNIVLNSRDANGGFPNVEIIGSRNIVSANSFRQGTTGNKVTYHIKLDKDNSEYNIIGPNSFNDTSTTTSINVNYDRSGGKYNHISEHNRLRVPGDIIAQAGGNVIVDNTAGNSRSVKFTTGALNRWDIVANTAAETGSNAGSDFKISRYADDGTYLSDAFIIRRNTGRIFFNTGGVPTYADNAAATAGGLAAGDIYRTAAGALMIRY